MHSEDHSFPAKDQFSIDVAAFVVETIPGTNIKLLRARPETEASLGTQLDITRRLKLLRRIAEPSPSTFLQDVTPVGQTSTGESVFLILSAIMKPSLGWHGGWGLAVVSPEESERFEAYLRGARKAIVAQLQYHAEMQP
jgi:hypothetical protein